MSKATSDNNKRIAKNTVLLYFRLFFNIIIQLYTVPIILQILGASDYGLYNVVGGITALFAFIGGSMTSGVQRFFSFALGEGDNVKVKNVFDTTITIFVCFSLIALLLFEVFGTWFLNTQMVIPEGRLSAANWIFQFSIFSFIVALITIPYNSVVIAHEKMNFYAYVSISVSLLKLFSIILLPYFQYDYLIIYGILVLLVQVLERFSYQYYCNRTFVECKHFKFRIDKELGRDILTYSGFNLIGSIAVILRKQGLNIVMNLFFGTILNAAHSIAMHINGVLEQFIGNLYMASRPQITKYYAAGEIDEMWKLTYRTCLLSYYLLMIIGIVAFIEMPTVLDLWLNGYPKYTVAIARIFIICLLLETTINQLSGVFQAYNKIKKWQLYASSILLLNVPIAYAILKLDDSNALYPYYIQIVFSLIYTISVLVVARKEINLNFSYYVINIIGREIVISLLTGGVVSCFVHFFAESIARIILTILLTTIISILFVILLGLRVEDRTYLKKKLKN